jgi:hypothetical protein
VPPSLSSRGELRNLPIELRNLRGQRVDLRHCLRDLGVGIRLRGREAVAVVLKAFARFWPLEITSCWTAELDGLADKLGKTA